jgi:glycogen debranching enzyme
MQNLPASAVPDGTSVVAGIIPALVSLQERRTKTLKQGDIFAVFDHNGDAISAEGRPEGIFYRDTRHLSQLYLTLSGKRPLLLTSALRDDNAVLTCDLTNPDFYGDGQDQLELDHDLIHIRRSRFLWQASCYERLAVRNFDNRPHRMTLEVWFSSDFADLFEVRGSQRPRRGTLHPGWFGRDAVNLTYTGLDSVRRQTRLRFHPAPNRLTADRAEFDLSLAPGEVVSLFIEVHCADVDSDTRPGPGNFFRAMRDARRALRAASSRAPVISSSNEIFDETARRSAADLYMLITDTPHGPYPYAGIPWFSTVFGRDALITAMEALWLDPAIAGGVLSYLAANQAQEIDPTADAEPGKILHEVRSGEMAELGEVPFRRYYGSVDSTPLFVMLAGAYLDRTADLDTIRRLWPNIEAALRWIEDFGDLDGDGFIEYGSTRPGGLINQGWKDSHDSCPNADGTLATGPIALVEVQAYVYAAWLAAAGMAAELGETSRAADLLQRAERLRQRFDEAFFDEDLGTYVLALDGKKRPVRVRSSNAGHALYTGIAKPERAGAVVATLMSPTSFTGWGIRTLASTEARYNPMSYHNGSVWPHDNAMIAAGFARYGFKRQALRLFEGLFTAAIHVDLRRLPELFCGFPRKRSQSPTSYPVACSPQAWAAVTPLSLLRSCLGIGFDPAANQINFDHPALPAFLDEVVLSNLSIGAEGIDVVAKRSNGEVAISALRRRGGLRLMVRS